MVDSDSSGQRGKRSISRRQLVKAIGATGVTAGLAGCSSGGGDSGGGTGGGDGTTVTIYSGTNHKENFDNQALHDAGVSDSITIRHTTGPQATGSKQQKLKIALDSEAKDPDLVMTDNGWTIPFITRGDLVNLEEEMDSEFIENVKNNGVQSMVETAQHPETGELYGVPAFPDFPLIEYRKDLFRQVGYDDSDFSSWQTDPPTWAEFSSIVAEAHSNSDVEYGHLWQGNNYVGLSCCTFNEFLTSMGGYFFGGKDNLFGPVGDRPVTIGEEKAVDGIELARDLIHGEGESPMDVSAVSPQEVAGWIEPDTLTQFAGDQPNAVSLRNWTYAIGEATSAFEGTDAELGAMPLPKGPNGSWHAQGGWLLTMNPHSDNKEAAKEVLKAWFSREVYEEQLDSCGLMPAMPSVMDYVEQHETFGPYFEAISYSAENLIPRPTTTVWPNQRDIIASEVNAAIRKEKSAAKAASSMQEQIQAIEDQVGG